MKVLHAGEDPKGWLAGPWDDVAPVAIGYATEAMDESHLHTHTTEIFLIAAGSAVARTDDGAVAVTAGDVVVFEPGESHTLTESSDGFRAFVVHAGGQGPDKISTETLDSSSAHPDDVAGDEPRVV